MLQKNILSVAKETISNEARAIEELINLVDQDFTAAVEHIYNAKGRVIITGIGKSAIIATKIVATLNSTGTPAIFMHAADAIHGDLGTIQEDDVVICTGFRVGEMYFGGFSQYAKVDSNFLIKNPKSISSEKSMMLGTAGFTALQCSFAIKAREELLLGEKVKDVLVTGATGGVGSVAVMVLSKLGYNVTAVTGKMDKAESLKKLGASTIIDRKQFEGEPKLLGKGIWDGVVDTVGGNILAHAISQTKHSGIVAACGNAGGIKLNTSVMPFILRGVKLWGIDSVAVSLKRREFVWSQVLSLIDFNILNETVKVVSMTELLDIFPQMLNGQTSGRIVVDVNK